jgi:hypothetical protein
MSTQPQLAQDEDNSSIMEDVSETKAQQLESLELGASAESDSSIRKRRRIPNSKYDDGISGFEEEEYFNSTGIRVGKMLRKTSEEPARQKSAPKVGLSGKDSVAEHVKSPKAKRTNSTLKRSVTTSRSRISMALNAEKISRILLRSLQVFGPLSSTQCAHLINKKRKQNVEVMHYDFIIFRNNI